jgi:LL-diaminopimelate aminotransferase
VDNFVRFLVADRLGGAFFDAESPYKFAVIKRLREEFRSRFSGVQILDMGVGEPSEGAPLRVVEAMREACGDPRNRFYPDSGCAEFHRAATQYMRHVFGVTLDPETEILHSVGIKAALSILPGCLVNPGDCVVTTTPGYSVFATHSRYYGGKVLPLKLLPENHFLPDLSALPEKVRHAVKVIVLNYPNNPTAQVATREFFQMAVDWAHRYGWVLVQDAAYAALAFDEPISLLQIPGAKEVSIELHSLSKGFNMAGWRLGWVCGNELLVKAYRTFKEHTDSGQFLAIQKAAVVALLNPDDILENNRRRYGCRYRRIHEIFERCGLSHFETKAGFFVYARAPSKAIHRETNAVVNFGGAEDFSRWLLQTCGILCVPWNEAGEYVRFSLSFDAPTTEEAFISELNRRLSSYVFSSV